jgi:hypothetical protein
MWTAMRKIRYEKPIISDYGSIADHTFFSGGHSFDSQRLPAPSF